MGRRVVDDAWSRDATNSAVKEIAVNGMTPP
jgi:hypothetical protein